MARTAERDEYQVGSTVGGLPTCTFPPKSYHRVITNIVVTNSVTSTVACYRGILRGSVPVAQNILGSNNTLRGEIKIPAGQAFYVQWSAAGTSPQQATARVQWERDDNPFEVEAGRNTGQEWATESVTSLQIPNGAGPDDPAIVVGSDLPPCMQTNYTAAIFFRPLDSLAPDNIPLYFMAQRSTLLAPFTQVVDFGFVIWNGTVCGYTVQERTFATNFAGAGNLAIAKQYGDNIESGGAVAVTTQQFQFRGATDIFVLDTSRLFVSGDRASFRNDCDNGACTANTNKADAAFANYPCNVTNSITKLDGAGNTCLVVEYAVTFVVDNATAGPKFAVSIGGTDYPTHQVPGTNPVGVRQSSVGFAKILGLAAGAYTVTPRWARYGGAGNVQAFINDDWVSLKVREEAL